MTHEIPEMKPLLPQSGAHIPMETSLRAWQQIAEDRLVAIETYKDEVARLQARLNGLRLPFAPVDDADWEYLLGPHAIGQGGRDQFWREVLRQTRAALGIYG